MKDMAYKLTEKDIQHPEEKEKSTLAKYIDLFHFGQLIDELKTEFKTSPILLPDRKVFEFFKRILPKEQTVDAEWSDHIDEIQLPESVPWLSDETQSVIIDLMKSLVAYHNLPIILDSYVDEPGERRMRKKAIQELLGGTFRQLIDSSKLRSQNLFSFNLTFISLRMHLQKEDTTNPKVVQLRSSLEELHNEFAVDGLPIASFADWPYEYKLRMARGSDVAIENFLFDLEDLYASTEGDA